MEVTADEVTGSLASGIWMRTFEFERCDGRDRFESGVKSDSLSREGLVNI